VKAAVVFGTRPEVIKLAPLIRELKGRRDAEVLVVTTGQHRELTEQAFGVFGIQPDIDFGLMLPKQTLSGLTSRLLPALDRLLADERPDVLVVQGDTTSAFVSALTAFYHRVPVAHVEAGLRTDNPADPFPEEINRRLTSVVTDFHFAPTLRASERLLAEGISPSRVWVTGNTVVDALQHIRGTDAFRKTPLAVDRGGRLLLVTLHRRESWGAVLEQMCLAIRRIVERHEDVRVAFPLHLNPTVRDCVMRVLGGIERVSLLAPLDYLSFLVLMDASWLVLTDSGGVQEEAPVLGKPVLVLRETTERPEAVESGVARLVGTRESAITEAAEELLCDPAARDRMARTVSPFGDGQASRRIADILMARPRDAA
jgi:UDP-N-acetylglucosamine 2-epimerase (non-hydrolysing)